MGKPLPEDQPVEVFTQRTAGLFGGGLFTYVLGFWLLARDHPDLAPVVIVAGILTMVWAFLG
jgi:hypothetical protein